MQNHARSRRQNRQVEIIAGFRDFVQPDSRRIARNRYFPTKKKIRARHVTEARIAKNIVYQLNFSSVERGAGRLSPRPNASCDASFDQIVVGKRVEKRR